MKAEQKTVNEILGLPEEATHTVDEILAASRKVRAERRALYLAEVEEDGRKTLGRSATEEESATLRKLNKSHVMQIDETAKALSKRLTLKGKELAKIIQWHVQRIPFQERDDMIQALAERLMEVAPTNPKLTFAVCTNYVRDFWKAFHYRQHLSIEAIAESGAEDALEQLIWLREDYVKAVRTCENFGHSIDAAEVDAVHAGITQKIGQVRTDARTKAERAELASMAHTLTGIAHYETIEHIDNADFARSVWDRLPTYIQQITLRKLNRVRLTRWEIGQLHTFAKQNSHLLLIES